MENCQSLAAQVGKMWSTFGPLIKLGAGASTAGAAVQIVEGGLKKWNELMNNSRLTVGPRLLTEDETLKGDILLAGQRAFVSAPTREAAVISFRKVDGNASAKVSICLFGPNEDHVQLRSFDLTADTPDGKDFTAEVPAGKVVTALIDSSSATKKLSYTLRLSTRS